MRPDARAARNPEAEDASEPEEEVLNLLREAIGKLVRDREPVTVLFSGGVDSSLVARLAAEYSPTRLMTIGFPGRPDLTAGSSGASALGLPHTEVQLKNSDVRDAIARWEGEIGRLRGPDRAVLLATALALEVAPSRVVACGQGADELFFGYRHYQGLSVDAAKERSREDLERLQLVVWPATVRIAAVLGLRIGSPFLDPRVIQRMQRIPTSRLMPSPEPKALLRRIAIRAGVPPELASRPKRAFQYGSGVQAALRRVDPEH